jgi:hypothetical protein
VNYYKLVIFNTLFKYDKIYLGVTLLIIIGWGSDYHVSGGPLLVISATAKTSRYADISQSGLEQNTSGRQWKVQMSFSPSCMGPLLLASINIL